MKSIILLSGPVGAGKSTVAKQLVKLLEGPVINMEGDVFWKFIAKGNPDHDGPKSFGMTMAAMITASLPYPKFGYTVIVDFSIPPWFLDKARTIISKKEIPLHYVVLRPSEKVCAERSVSRVEGYIEYNEVYRQLYRSFDSAQRYMIPDEHNEPAVIAAKIKEGLDEGIFLAG